MGRKRLLVEAGLDLINRGGKRFRTLVKNMSLDKKSPRMRSAQRLSDAEFLSLFEIKTVTDFRGQGKLEEAKLALIKHYRDRSISTWPAVPKNITDLRLNTGDLNGDELNALAESILDFRVTHSEHKPKVSAHGKIDWAANPTTSREWILRLNRHQWWPVLGLAYAQTQDERYAREFVAQMLDWIKQNPPPPCKNEGSHSWRLMEAGLRMRISWIPAFALFSQSRHFSDEAKLVMLRSIYDHATFLSLFKSKLNHLLRESNGLACVSIYFPEFNDAKKWRDQALHRLEAELQRQVNQDGTHIEVSTGYQWLVIDEFEQTYELLKSNNLSLPNEDLGAWLENMYQVLARLIRPDGSFPEINDGFILESCARLINAGERFGREDFIYIGSRGETGIVPKINSAGIKDAGLFAMRSDWSVDSRYLLFDAGPYGGFHGHEDKLSIEVYAYAQRFIVDSGSYTYEKTDPFRNYFVGAQGHNTLLVDGLSQIRRWQGHHMTPMVADGHYATWVSQSEFDYVMATYSEGYGEFLIEKSQVQASVDDVAHTRRVLFVKPDYWVIIDELQATSPHDYQLLFHTPPEIKVHIESHKQLILRTQPGSACLYILSAYPQEISVRTEAGRDDPIQGWYSVDHHRKAPSTAIIYEKRQAVNAVLATLLYPRPAGQEDDGVTIEPLDVGDGSALAYIVTTEQGKDYIMFSREKTLTKLGDYEIEGIVAGVRTNRYGDKLGQFELKHI